MINQTFGLLLLKYALKILVICFFAGGGLAVAVGMIMWLGSDLPTQEIKNRSFVLGCVIFVLTLSSFLPLLASEAKLYIKSKLAKKPSKR